MPRIATAIRKLHCLPVAYYSWGRIYRGTKQELIDGGVACQDERFPGEPGENKCMKKTTHPDGGRLGIRRVSAERFEVHWILPDFKNEAGILQDCDSITDVDPVFTIQEERLKPAPVDGRRLRAARNNATFQKLMQSLTKE